MCPGAPLLVPGVAPALVATVPDLLESCRLAVASLAGADRILLLTSGPRMRDRGTRATRPTVLHPPGTPISSAALTGGGWPAHFDGLLSTGTPATPTAVAVAARAGVGVVVGAALLAGGLINLPTTAVELGDEGASPAELYAAAGSSADRIGVLLIGEGSAARGPDSPAGPQREAADLDGQLGRALADGDPSALSGAVSIGRAVADRLMFSAGPGFAALAALTADRAPLLAHLLYDEAPFGVGYLVATWSLVDSPVPAAGEVSVE